ncbi:hypothetical protein HDU78_000955 [Chytriomyces hyalinus]|nr:hypothetical protein HDU78_000955 [Chytriomyces hyalinus]KAJ3265665.1 hypothetical protein HDU77_004438 [Chytriomyces hyalinus]
MIRKLSRASLQALCGNEYYILLTNDTSVSIEVVGTVSLAFTSRLVLDDPFVLKPGESRQIECKQGRIFAFKHYTGTPTSDWSIWFFNAFSVAQSIATIVGIVTTLGLFTEGIVSGAACMDPTSLGAPAHQALVHIGMVKPSFAGALAHMAGVGVGHNLHQLPPFAADQLLTISQAFSEAFQVAIQQPHAVIPPDIIRLLMDASNAMNYASMLKWLAEMIPGVVPGIEKLVASFRKSGANPDHCRVTVKFDKKSEVRLKNGRLHVRSSEIPCHFSIQGGLTSSVEMTETIDRIRRICLTYSLKPKDFTQEKTFSKEFFPRKSGSVFHFV